MKFPGSEQDSLFFKGTLIAPLSLQTAHFLKQRCDRNLLRNELYLYFFLTFVAKLILSDGLVRVSTVIIITIDLKKYC